MLTINIEHINDVDYSRLGSKTDSITAGNYAFKHSARSSEIEQTDELLTLINEQRVVYFYSILKHGEAYETGVIEFLKEKDGSISCRNSGKSKLLELTYTEGLEYTNTKLYDVVYDLLSRSGFTDIEINVNDVLTVSDDLVLSYKNYNQSGLPEGSFIKFIRYHSAGLSVSPVSFSYNGSEFIHGRRLFDSVSDSWVSNWTPDNHGIYKTIINNTEITIVSPESLEYYFVEGYTQGIANRDPIYNFTYVNGNSSSGTFLGTKPYFGSYSTIGKLFSKTVIVGTKTAQILVTSFEKNNGEYETVLQTGKLNTDKTDFIWHIHKVINSVELCDVSESTFINELDTKVIISISHGAFTDATFHSVFTLTIDDSTDVLSISDVSEYENEFYDYNNAVRTTSSFFIPKISDNHEIVEINSSDFYTNNGLITVIAKNTLIELENQVTSICVNPDTESLEGVTSSKKTNEILFFELSNTVYTNIPKLVCKQTAALTMNELANGFLGMFTVHNDTAIFTLKTNMWDSPAVIAINDFEETSKSLVYKKYDYVQIKNQYWPETFSDAESRFKKKGLKPAINYTISESFTKMLLKQIYEFVSKSVDEVEYTVSIEAQPELANLFVGQAVLINNVRHIVSSITLDDSEKMNSKLKLWKQPDAS